MIRKFAPEIGLSKQMLRGTGGKGPMERTARLGHEQGQVFLEGESPSSTDPPRRPRRQTSLWAGTSHGKKSKSRPGGEGAAVPGPLPGPRRCTGYTHPPDQGAQTLHPHSRLGSQGHTETEDRCASGSGTVYCSTWTSLHGRVLDVLPSA